MSRPADGLVSVLRDAPRDLVLDEVYVAGVVSAWLADHLDALAETDKVDRGSFRLAATEVRSAGGVQ